MAQSSTPRPVRSRMTAKMASPMMPKRIAGQGLSIKMFITCHGCLSRASLSGLDDTAETAVAREQSPPLQRFLRNSGPP